MNRSQAATNREVPVSKTIPYRSHVSPHVVNTEAGDLVTVFKVSGVAHESADVEDVDSWHNRLNGLLKTIQSPNVTLWTHTIRQKRGEYPQGDFVPGAFAAEVDDAYRGRVTQTEMMANDLYVTVVYSPNENKLKKLVAKIFDRLDPAEVRAKIEDALEAIEDVARQVKAGLGEWGPVRLGWYEEDGVTYSEVMELFGYLLNMEWQRWPVPRLNPGVDTTIAGVLATARPFMGAEAFEIRGATKSRVGGILALKEYPAWTSPGFVNKLLSLPCEFILTQSFRFIPKQAALGMLARQQSKMVQSGEVSGSLVQQMNDALDHLSAGRFVMGEHHLSLTLLAGTLKDLNDNIAEAKSNLSDCGGVPAREDWGLEAAFWAQLPGNFRWRSRPAPVTSFNFAGFCAMHNYPTGLAAGNQWGPAVTMFKTASGTPYYFNFHLPPKKRKRGRDALRQVEVKVDDRVAGNTLIIGPTGSGKTVVQTLLLAQLEKFKPTIFYYDKDRGMEIFFRALGGNYLTIENGIPTGFNPFRIEPNAGNVSFLQTIVRKLVKAGGDVHLTPVQEKDIDNAIDGVLGLPEEMRRLGSMLQFMDPTDPAGPAARLERWCAGGALGWVFDNEVDEIDPNKNRINGFDITDLLDNDQVREPVLMYLLHRQEEVIDGRRIVLGFDEGWKVLYDEWLSAYVENKELTIRKQDGFVIFGTQNPSHVIKSRISDTLVQQSVTQIYMPNDKASREDYINGFKLSEREYEIIKDVMPVMPGRYFLVKQGKHSAICELDLAGLDNILAVLSGTTSTVELLNHIRAELGPDCTPADWLPVFHERRKLS